MLVLGRRYLRWVGAFVLLHALLLTLESACPCEGVGLLAPEEVSLSDCGEGFFPLGISATAGSP